MVRYFILLANNCTVSNNNNTGADTVVCEQMSVCQAAPWSYKYRIWKTFTTSARTLSANLVEKNRGCEPWAKKLQPYLCRPGCEPRSPGYMTSLLQGPTTLSTLPYTNMSCHHTVIEEHIVKINTTVIVTLKDIEYIVKYVVSKSQ